MIDSGHRPASQLPAPIVTTEVVADRLVIKWSRIEGAARYELELRTPRDEHASWYGQAGDLEMSFDASLLPRDPYRLRVRAHAEDGAGAWSTPERLAAPATMVVADALPPLVSETAAATIVPPVPGMTLVGDTVYANILQQSEGSPTSDVFELGGLGEPIFLSKPPNQLPAAHRISTVEGRTELTLRAKAIYPGFETPFSDAISIFIDVRPPPTTAVTFEGGTLFGHIVHASGSPSFFTFFAGPVGEDFVFIASATPSQLPVAFPATFSDGQRVFVSARAEYSDFSTALGAQAEMVIKTVPPPVLQLGFTSPGIKASWSQLQGFTRYQFELWTTGSPPQKVFGTQLSAPPYTVTISSGLVDGQTYLGKVRKVDGQNFSTWSTATIEVPFFNPLLDALAARFKAAIGSGTTLPIDATTLGSAGAAIVTLMQNNIGAPQIVVVNPAITPNTKANTLTVTGNAQDTILGIDHAAITAVFTASKGAIVANIAIALPVGWSLSQSFKLLEGTTAGSLTWSDDVGKRGAFVLFSLGAPPTTTSGALVAGLNFLGWLDLTGAAAALRTLVPGAADPLLVTGPVTFAGTDVTMELAAPLTDLSISHLPGLGTLAFDAPQFTLFARTTPNGPVNALRVGADVIVGGVTVPLAVQLPMEITGWVIMLRPGKAVPVPSLSSFFAFVSGANIPGALRTEIVSQTGLQLDTFRITVDPSFTSFQSVTIGLGSTTGAASPLWSPLPGILDLTTLDLFIQLVPSGGTLAISGRISGAVVFGGTLRLSASIAIPLASGNWIFSALVASSLPSLDAFNGLTGGSSFAAALPAGLGTLPRFTSASLTLVVDPKAPALTSIAFQFLSDSDWSIVGDQVVVTSIAVNLSMSNPTQSTRQVTGDIDCSLVVGSVLVDALIQRVDASSNWTLNVQSDSIPLPSLGDLADLIGGDGAAALLPSSLATRSFSLQDVAVVVDLTQRKLEKVGFTLTTDTWAIFPNDALTASDVSATLSLDWTSGSLVTSGFMFGVIGVAGARFSITAAYQDAVWTIDATMSGTLDFSGALTQFGVASQFLIPSNVGLPALTLTSGSLHLVPSTGELSITATSALSWPIAFGTGKQPMRIASLGGTLNRLANDGGWNASITGALSYNGINGAVSVQLGSEGTDTIVTASIDNASSQAIVTTVDGLATDAWPASTLPADLPSVGMTQVQLFLNLTRNTLVLLGSSTAFGTAAFVVQKVGTGWEAALGINLAATGKPWTFGQISKGLELAGTVLNIDNATAAMAISTIDGQSLEAIAQQVPELAEAIPSTVARGLNFYGVLNFSGSVLSNVPKILRTDSSATVTMHALIAEQSSQSFFRVLLDQATLAGVVTFSNIFLQYQPATSPAITLHGDITIPVGGTKYLFTGDMTVADDRAQFRVQQSPQKIVKPFGMPITISKLGAQIDYTFSDDDTTSSVAVQLTGTTAIGAITTLQCFLYLLDGTPAIASVTVKGFDITNLAQSVGVAWPSSLVPIVFTTAVIYDYVPVKASDPKPITLHGTAYQPGFNVSARLEILGVPATLTIAVTGNGFKGAGSLDHPIDLGFLAISGIGGQGGPSASLQTFPTTSFMLSAAFTIFGVDAGEVTFTIEKTGGENVGTMTFTKDLGAPFGTRTLVVHWSKSRGFFFDFPLDFPAYFNIHNIAFPEDGACAGKEILRVLPIKTQYNFDSDFTISGGKLVITFQGFFELKTLDKTPLRVDLQTLTFTIAAPSGGDSFRWSDIPIWIADTLTDNAYSLLKQVLSDPASMAKLLALQGLRYVTSAVIDALVCEGEPWTRENATELLEKAESAFEQPVDINGVKFLVGGHDHSSHSDGSGGPGPPPPPLPPYPGSNDDDGGDDDPPPTPAMPEHLAMLFTGDRLSMTWSAAEHAETYAWRLQDSTSSTVASSYTSSTSASVSVTLPLTLGAAYTITVSGDDDGVRGPQARVSFTIPTPASVAQSRHADGTALELAGVSIRQIFPSVLALVMGNAIVNAYGAADPAAFATKVATALRNGGYDKATTNNTLPRIFPGITTEQRAAAINSAYSLTRQELVQYLHDHGATAQQAAQMVKGVHPAILAPNLVGLLRESYKGIDASTLVSALAGTAFTMDGTAPAVNTAIATPPQDMATALVKSYSATVATPVAVGVVLQAVYAWSAPSTFLTLVQSLQQAFALPAPVLTFVQAAQALVAAFAKIPMTAPTAAQTLATGFGYPATITLSEIAIAVAAAFPAGDETAIAKALASISSPAQPSSSAIAAALTAAFSATTPSRVAIALVGSLTIEPKDVGLALLATFNVKGNGQLPIGTNDVAIALVAAFTTPAPIAPRDVAKALTLIFTGITTRPVAVALVAAFPAPPAPSAIAMDDVAAAIVFAFETKAPLATTALALVTAFPAGTAPQVVEALVFAFGLARPIERFATALAAAFRQPPISPHDLLVALQSTLTTLTAKRAAISLVSAFTTPAITPAQVVQELLGVTFSTALRERDIADALVAAFTSLEPVTSANAAAVVAALIDGFNAAGIQPPPDAKRIAISLVAAYETISAPLVAQTLQAAPFAAPLSIPANAAGVVFAFPKITASDLIAALFAAYTAPPPAPLDIARALAATMRSTITPTSLAQFLFEKFKPGIDANTMATVIVDAMSLTRVGASSVVEALQAAFTAPSPITLNAAGQAIQQAYAAKPLGSSFFATELAEGWKPKPLPQELAPTIVQAFPKITAVALAQALIAALPKATAQNIAAAITGALPKAGPKEIANALVATFTTPPIGQERVAKAIFLAIPKGDPVTIARGLIAVFGTAATPVSIASAFASVPVEVATVASVIKTVFTLNATDNAVALARAFKTASPTAVLGALVQLYGEKTLPPSTGAAALYAAFVAPSRITPSGVAIALAAVYQKPAALGWWIEITKALIAAFATKPLQPSDAAIALAAAFAAPAPISASNVAQALAAAFTQPLPIRPESVAIALVAAFPSIQPGDVLTALQSAFPILPPLQAVRPLAVAFTQPMPISPTDVAKTLAANAKFKPLAFTTCVQALQPAFPRLAPSQAAVVLVATFSPQPQQVVTALTTVYPALSAAQTAQALVAAFVKPAITSEEVATAIRAIPSLTASDIAIALVAAFVQPPIPWDEMSKTLQKVLASKIDDVAIALVRSFTTPALITPSAVATTVKATFPSATATMQAVASALLSAFTRISANDLATALWTAFPAAKPAQVAAILVQKLSAGAVAQALVAARPSIKPVDVMTALTASVTTDLMTLAAALAGAFPSLPSAQVAPALVGGATGATVDQIAAALVSAYAYTAANITALLSALVAGYVKSPQLFDPAIASMALQTSLALPNAKALALTTAIGNQFQLTATNEVGALAVCLNHSNISLTAASTAMAAFFGAKWSAQTSAVLMSAYTAPEWQTAYVARSLGMSTVQTAALFHVPAPQMTTVLASVYFLTTLANDNITQVASGMKAAGFSLTQTIDAMSSFYPGWGDPQKAIVMDVFS